MRQFKPGQLRSGSLYPITSSFAITASYVSGINLDTGSLTTTASFNAFTASYTTGSFTGSFTGALNGTASFAISSSRSVSASFAIQSLSASYAPFIPTDTSSLLTTASISNATITFTKGNGTTFPVTVNNVVSASFATSASQAVSSSFATRALSASFATSASWAPDTTFPYSGSAVITGTLGINGSLTVLNSNSRAPIFDTVESIIYGQNTSASIDWDRRSLHASDGATSIHWGDRLLYDNNETLALDWSMRNAYSSTALVIDWENLLLMDPEGKIALVWKSRNTLDASGAPSIDWDKRQLIKSDGDTIAFDWENGALTSSLHGTASWANNAISSSFATTASFATQALTSSFATQALTSSFATQALSASFATQALSASYALNGGVTQLLAGPNVTLSPTNGLGQVTVSATLSGSTIFNTATGSYGSFYDTTTQTNPVANIARSMSFNSTDITNGVSISGSTSPFNTYIKTTNAGVYDIQFSAQVEKTDSGTDEIVIWLRKNGIDLTDSATKLTLSGNSTKVVAAWNWFVSSAANDYYQIIWVSADTGMRLYAEPQDGTPGIPSVILTANRVDQFLSNTGSFSGSFTGAFTGSLHGTSSFANNSLTSSFATQALTSSFATQALSASFATQADSSSFATTALTASFLNDGYITLTTTSDQDVTNNNSANAPELFFSGSANAVYEIEFKLIMSSNNTTADSRFGFRTGTGGNVLMGAATIPSISTTFGGAAQLMQVSSSFTSVVPMGTPPAADLRYPLTATGTICLFISANDTIGVTFGNSTATIGATTRLWAGSTVKYKRIK